MRDTFPPKIKSKILKLTKNPIAMLCMFSNCLDLRDYVMHSEHLLFKNSEVSNMPQFPKGEAYANLPRDKIGRAHV